MALAAFAFFLLLGGVHPTPLTVKLRPVRHRGHRLHPGKWQNFGEQARSFELLELGFDLPVGAVLQNVSFSGPGGLQFLAEPRSDTLDLRNVNSLLYTAKLHVGIAGRSAQVVVDTGSGDFWLKPEMLVEEVDGRKHVSAAPRSVDIGGMQQLPPEFSIRYGLGAVTAIPVTEELLCFASECLKHFELMLALKVEGVQELGLFDGLAGLAFPLLQQAPTNQTFLQALQHQTHFRHFGFSLALRGEKAESILSLGEVEELVKAVEKEAGAPGASVPVEVLNTRDQQPGYWMVQVKMDVYHSQRAVLRAHGAGILDSGSSFLALPEEVLGYVVLGLVFGHGGPANLAVIGSQRLLARCGTTLNDLVFEVPGEDGRTLQVNLTTDDLLEESPISLLSDWCALRILPIPRTANIPFMILGDPFLRKVSAVFDVQGPRVHLLPTGGQGSSSLAAEEAPSQIQGLGHLGHVPALALGLAALAGVAGVAGLGIWAFRRPAAEAEQYMKM